MNFIKRWIEDFKLAIKVIKIMKRDLKENPRKLIADMQSTCDNSWLKILKRNKLLMKWLCTRIK
jgi:hypothetical protein